MELILCRLVVSSCLPTHNDNDNNDNDTSEEGRHTKFNLALRTRMVRS